MRISVCILISQLIINFSAGQALITKPAHTRSIKDFGAVANDKKDDSWAFIKAGKYFSNQWDINGRPLKNGKVNFNYAHFSARLEIPSGTYLVGRQVNVPASGLKTDFGAIFNSNIETAAYEADAGGAFKAGLELFTLKNKDNNIDQVLIRGTGATKPVIKYNDGLYVGYFDGKGKPLFLTYENYDNKYAVSVGSLFATLNCKNIQIENLDIDGNNIPLSNGGTTIYDGGLAGDLIQLGAAGLYLTNTKNVTVKNVSIHHMTLDGIIFNDFYKDPAKFPGQAFSNLLLQKTRCDYNRRQGFSWVGGRKVTAEDCSFSNTGTTVNGKAAGNPGAGLDIEPESDGSNWLWCMDGSFVNCVFVNNTGCALVNDQALIRTASMNFTGCTFHDVSGYSVWVKGNGFRFTKCKIWGGFVYGNSGEDVGQETKFFNCDFADEEIAGLKGKYNEGYALVESWQYSRRMFFSGCTFRTLHKSQRLLAVYSPTKNERDFTVFSNCRFTIGSNSHGDDVLFGAAFDKNNSFTSNNQQQPEIISVNGIVFTGSNVKSVPYKFTLQGKINLFAANTNGHGITTFALGRNGIGSDALNGFFDLQINNNACLQGYWNQVIDIGKNARLINNTGGQLAILNGSLNNAGKIVLNANSYTAFFNPLAINSANSGTAGFYYDKNAVFGTSPVWSKQFEGLGNAKPLSAMKISANTVIDGGNRMTPVQYDKTRKQNN